MGFLGMLIWNTYTLLENDEMRRNSFMKIYYFELYLLCKTLWACPVLVNGSPTLNFPNTHTVTAMPLDGSVISQLPPQVRMLGVK